MSNNQKRLIDCLKKNSSFLNLNTENSEINIESLEESFLNLSTNTIIVNKMDAQAFARLLPNFDGNSDHLEQFINSIDDFYLSFYNTSEVQKKYVFSAIKSKLIGEAHNLLFCRPDITKWDELKSALRQKFGDPISFLVLLHQLNYFNKPKNESLMDFITRLKQFIQRIYAKIQSEQVDENVRKAFQHQTEKTAIITLISNSPDVLKSYLLMTNPNTLNDAISCITNYNLIESQVDLRQQLNKQNNIQHTISRNNNYSNSPQRPAFPSDPLNIQPRQMPPRKFPTNIPAFKQPQPKFNVFAPQRNATFPKPIPMSSINSPIPENPSSRNTQSMRTYRPNNVQYHNQSTSFPRNNHFQNSGQKRNFISQELTNLECSYVPEEDDNTDHDYTNDPNFLNLPEEDANYDASEELLENFTITAPSPEST